MASITEMLFFISFIALIALVFMKMWNIFSAAELFDKRIVWSSFAGILLFFGINFVAAMLKVDELIYFMMFRFSGLLLGLGTLFHFIEVVLQISNAAGGKVEPYNSKKMQNG